MAHKQKEKAERFKKSSVLRPLGLKVKQQMRTIRAANAENETAQLYALTAPRRLTPDQLVAIKAELKKFAGKQVVVSSYGLDGEGAGLGTQIVSILNASGIYAVDQLASSIVTGGFETGIQVHGPAEQQELVHALYLALHYDGKTDCHDQRPQLNGLTGMGAYGGIGGGAGMGVGSARTGPAGPTTKGTPVTIVIGIKPIRVHFKRQLHSLVWIGERRVRNTAGCTATPAFQVKYQNIERS